MCFCCRSRICYVVFMVWPWFVMLCSIIVVSMSMCLICFLVTCFYDVRCTQVLVLTVCVVLRHRHVAMTWLPPVARLVLPPYLEILTVRTAEDAFAWCASGLRRLLLDLC